MFPAEPQISHNAQHIIRSLCTVDRSRRLGNINGGAARVKEHPFFEGVNWETLIHQDAHPPIQPHIRFPGDAQCFDIYPEDDGRRDLYTDELAEKYDQYFESF
jgi:protein kinase A